MSLSDPFVRRPVMTTLVMVAILFLGITAYFRLPVSDLPNVDYPTITVTVGYPGASPETMANTVATPLEKEFMTIPGISLVTSTNNLGRSEIVLEFDIKKSIEAAAQDVEAAISRATPFLPPELPSPPSYKKVNPSDSPIMYIALTSPTLPLSDLYTYAYTYIGQRLSMLEGVAQVLTYGSPYAVRVEVDPGALATRGITLTEVAEAIHNGNPQLPTGQLDGRVRSEIIVADGQLKTAAEYQPLVITYQNQAPVRIRDIGEAVDSLQDTRIQLRYIDKNKSQPTVVLAVQRQPGANTVMLSNKVKEYLPKLEAMLPASVNLHIVFDKAQSIENSIEEVKFTLLVALFLVVAVIFIYLGNIVDTLIPSVAMPMSIIGTFWAMDLLGYSLDNLSLLALILATGFIVDDAIVVLENIVRRMEMGESRWEASLNGAKQISFTILSMTLSLLAVFIPMVYMPGLLGKILREFSITMMVVIFASGVISLTLTPMLCSRFIANRHHDKATKGFAAFAQRMNARLLHYYDVSLQWVLKRQKLALGVGLLSVILSGIFYIYLPKDFIPDDDMGFIIGFTQTNQGTSPERMTTYQNQVAELISKNPYVESFVSLNSYPQIHQGMFFIHLTPHQSRPSASKIIQGLYGTVGGVPGVNSFFKNVPLINLTVGGASRGAYQYTLQSLNMESLFEASEKLLINMQGIPGFQAVSSDVEIKTPQLKVDILRDQASTLGVTANQIESTLLLAYSGNRVSRIATPYNQYDVILELKPRYRRQSSSLDSIYVRSDLTKNMVPLNAVADWKEILGPSSISHISQFPSATISFNLMPGVPLGTALENLDAVASKTLPEDVTGSVQGAAQTFQESVQNIGLLILVAIFAIYIVLGILYESFIHPLTILSSLPPAILGGLLTLFLFGLPLSLYGYLGIILLIGIVKKNGIMMVDFALDNMREKGESAEKSIYDACIVRFRPIMMTTLAAIMGALPIALGAGAGADARRPLGLVIIGGLLLSQLITLYLTPVIYLQLEKLNERFSEKDKS